jgi:hypothetical protein
MHSPLNTRTLSVNANALDADMRNAVLDRRAWAAVSKLNNTTSIGPIIQKSEQKLQGEGKMPNCPR